MTKHPIPDAYWADEGKLLIGPRPGDADRQKQKQKIQKLLDAGIRCVIDLTTPSDAAALRVPWQRLAEIMKVDLVWMSSPVSDAYPPSDATIETLLDVIDRSIERGRPVYVHSNGGVGRSGVVAGCFMVRHAMVPDGTAAIQRMQELREGQPEGNSPSPETPPQREALRNWTKGR